MDLNPKESLLDERTKNDFNIKDIHKNILGRLDGNLIAFELKCYLPHNEMCLNKIVLEHSCFNVFQ